MPTGFDTFTITLQCVDTCLAPFTQLETHIMHYKAACMCRKGVLQVLDHLLLMAKVFPLKNDVFSAISICQKTELYNSFDECGVVGDGDSKLGSHEGSNA
ncbi:hypothetical protein ILYODFUR_020311 [Ilyodon furcidens]|uniref:Uncharacterized protein n=1 Tax=Ilyodon furcidens TaxID=33524 RepID=A0ABV0TN09_9TELE